MIEHELYQYKNRLEQAHYAGGRGTIIAELQERTGWSRNTCYRKLHAVGYTSGNKRRKDAKTTQVDTNILLMIAAIIQEGIRENGKRVMSVARAVSIVKAAGYDIPVSNQQLAALLKQRNLHTAALKNSRAYTQLRSEHPNHVHMVDPSLYLGYFSPQNNHVEIADGELYKNKPELFTKLGKRKLWRYVLVDHYSACIYVRYYEAEGENMLNLWDFLLHAWTKKDNNPFHGAPHMLMMDKGSGNTSAAITNALASLDVHACYHAPHHAWVKGAVEKANHIVERTFEAIIKYEPVSTVVELNTYAENFCTLYNANTIPHFDSRLNRNGYTYVREQLWLQITNEQLRIMPDISLCYALLTQEITRTVNTQLCIRLRHGFTKQNGIYNLAHIPHIMPRQKVQVISLAYHGSAILVVYTDDNGDTQRIRIDEPLTLDNGGFTEQSVLIGTEYKSQKHTSGAQQKEQLQKIMRPHGKTDIPLMQAHNGAGLRTLSTLSHAHDTHSAKYKTIPKIGTAIAHNTFYIHDELLSIAEAAKRLYALCTTNGIKWDTRAIHILRAHYPQGIYESQLEDAQHKLLEQESEDATDEERYIG